MIDILHHDKNEHCFHYRKTLHSPIIVEHCLFDVMGELLEHL